MGLLDFVRKLKDDIARKADAIIPGDQSSWYTHTPAPEPTPQQRQIGASIGAAAGLGLSQPSGAQTALIKAANSPTPTLPATATAPAFKPAPPPIPMRGPVTPIDVAAEFAKGIGNSIKDLAQGTARVAPTVLTSVAQPAADAINSAMGQPTSPITIDPSKLPGGKVLFGSEPIGTYQSQADKFSQTLKDLGLNDTASNAASIPAAGGMAALDLFSGGKSKAIIKELAGATTEQTVKELLTKQFGNSATKISDDVIKAIAKEKDANKVAGILKGGPIGPVNPQNVLNDLPPSAAPEVQAGVSDYVKSQVKAQQDASKSSRGFFGKFVNDFKQKLIDTNAPIEDIMNRAIKGGADIAPTRNISYQIDRVLRADQPATQFVKDNGLENVIKQTPNIDELNQYLIARHAPEWAANGLETGRNAEKDAQLVQALGPKYEAAAQQVSAYNQKLLDVMSKPLEEGGYGLISPESAQALKEKYPNYVPFNRIFGEDELTLPQGNGGGIASLSSQSIVQKATGSKRAIENPVESMLVKTAQVFKQGEVNRAADMLASYKDLPGNPFGVRPLGPTETIGTKATFSVVHNGVKQIYETTPEVAKVAKNLTPSELGLLGKIAAIPARTLRLGATGINLPFALSNVARDQITGFINADKGLRTSALNPINFSKALWGAIGHGKEYEELLRNAAGGTSFDMFRNSAPKTVERIRASRNIPSRIAYTVRHPSELIRAAEDVIGRSEELTRIQQFRGTREALGGANAENNILAANAARNNTTNFSRHGEYMKALNLAIPYLNAAVQGTRVFLRSAKDRPLATGFKVAAVGLLPMAGITAWNLADPDRRKAYDDIRKNSEFELQNNFVIIPDNPTQDDKGRWNVIKIPLSQEISNLLQPVRRTLEAAADDTSVDINAIAADLFQTVTSVDTHGGLRGLANSFTPQAVKPGIEAITNQNLFTGSPIVPDELKNYPAAEQYNKHTSETAKRIGETLGISPLQIENFIGTVAGGVGRQIVNLSDRLMGAEKPGGQDIADAASARFSKARGTTEGSQYFKQREEAIKGAGLSKAEEDAYTGVIHPSTTDPRTGEKLTEDPSPFAQSAKAEAYLRYPKLFQLDAQLAQNEPVHDPIFDLNPQQAQAELLIRIYNKVAPGELGKDKALLRAQLPADFQDKTDNYYSALDAKLGSQSSTSTGPIYPTKTPELQSLMDQYAALGTNTKAKHDFKAAHPELDAYYAQTDAYYNAKRSDIGLPNLADVSPYPTKTSTGGRKTGKGSRGGKVAINKGGSVRTPTIKVAKIKAPKAVRTKVSTVKKVKVAKVKVAKAKLA